MFSIYKYNRNRRLLTIGRKSSKFARARSKQSDRYSLPGPADSQSPCSGSCRPIISDLEALSELVAGLRLDSTLASYLRQFQLLGLQTFGCDAPSRAPGGRGLAAAT